MKLPIRRPCPLKANALRFGDDNTAFCGACKQTVHDLSAGSEERARAIVARRDAGEAVCVRYQADRSGNLVFDRARTAAAAAMLSVAPAALADGGDRFDSNAVEVLHELQSTAANERRTRGTELADSSGAAQSNHRQVDAELQTLPVEPEYITWDGGI